MGVAPEGQCHAFTGKQRLNGYPQPIGLRERGSCATDGEAVNLKLALFWSGFFVVRDSPLPDRKLSGLEPATLLVELPAA